MPASPQGCGSFRHFSCKPYNVASTGMRRYTAIQSNYRTTLLQMSSTNQGGTQEETEVTPEEYLLELSDEGLVHWVYTDQSNQV